MMCFNSSLSQEQNSNNKIVTMSKSSSDSIQIYPQTKAFMTNIWRRIMSLAGLFHPDTNINGMCVFCKNCQLSDTSCVSNDSIRYLELLRRYRFVAVFSRSVVSDSLWLHRLQHARLPWPSLPPGACSSSCPLSQQCHPTISSCHSLFLLPQSLPESGPFPMSWLFASGEQSVVLGTDPTG